MTLLVPCTTFQNEQCCARLASVQVWLVHLTIDESTSQAKSSSKLPKRLTRQAFVSRHPLHLSQCFLPIRFANRTVHSSVLTHLQFQRCRDPFRQNRRLVVRPDENHCEATAHHIVLEFSNRILGPFVGTMAAPIQRSRLHLLTSAASCSIVTFIQVTVVNDKTSGLSSPTATGRLRCLPQVDRSELAIAEHPCSSSTMHNTSVMRVIEAFLTRNAFPVSAGKTVSQPQRLRLVLTGVHCQCS